MNCKNCASPLNSTALYCNQCGAKVIKNRLTIASTFQNLKDDFLGWDNKFLKTSKNLLLQPQRVILPYLEGTRKKYVSPFLYLAIATTFSLIIFNFFIDDFLAIARSSLEDESLKKYPGMQKIIEKYDEMNIFTLKYYNIITLLYIPLFAIISRIAFGKRHNYAEHIVINSYLQAFGLIIVGLLFLVSVATSFSEFFAFSLFLTYLYITFSFIKLGYPLWKAVIFLFMSIFFIFFINIIIFLFLFLS